MRRSLSMRGCALSADLHLSQRLGGAAARQAGGVATRDTQPHHTTILIFLRPRALTNSSDRLKTWQKYRA